MPSASPATIAALATPPGEGGLAVIRISGPDSLAVADRVFQCDPPPSVRSTHTAAYGFAMDEEGCPLDSALLLVMRGPNSYTGEDVAEIQCHGGRQTAAHILDRLFASGARPAEPGEFTRRAFLNGKLDLAQAEAVLSLIRAGSDHAARAAFDQLQGKLSARVNRLYDGIMAAMARIEASIDFTEDVFTDNIVRQELPSVRQLHDEIKALADSWKEGRVIRDGLRVVILGRPNAGKSSLFNRLLGIPRAIVSEHAGTTRDTIEAEIQLGGMLLRLVDTAGLRNSSCSIEQEGVRRSLEQAGLADLFIYLLDASLPPDDEDRKFIEERRDIPGIIVLNKIDHPNSGKYRENSKIKPDSEISSSLNIGMDIFINIVISKSTELYGSSDQVHALSQRHASLFRDAEKDTAFALELMAADRQDFIVPICAHLRNAAECLGGITGRIYSEDLLDGIFSQFCVGK